MNLNAIEPIQLALLFIGVGLILRGWRGRPVWSTPTCRKCGYDLRGSDQRTTPSCPECGADLALVNAVRFGRWNRQARIIVVGVFCLLIPICWLGANATLRAMGKTWRDFRSNSSVIADLANPNADASWDDVVKRYQGNQLSDAEITQIVDRIVASTVTGARGGLATHRQREFVQSLALDSRLSAAHKAALGEASIAADPVVSLRSKVRQGTSVRFSIDANSAPSWDMPGTEQLVALRSVRCGESVLIDHSAEEDDQTGFGSARTGRFSGSGRFLNLNGEFKASMEPGPHELVFEIDRGMVDEESGGFGNVQGPGRAEEWPPTLNRRRAVLKVPITVLPPDQSPIELVHDPAILAASKGAINIRAVQLRTMGDANRLMVDVQMRGRPPVALAFDVFVEVDGKEYKTGTFHARNGGMGQSGSSPAIRDLPPDTMTAKVILRPNQEVAEGMVEADQICGDEIIFDDVPIKRAKTPQPKRAG